MYSPFSETIIRTPGTPIFRRPSPMETAEDLRRRKLNANPYVNPKNPSPMPQAEGRTPRPSPMPRWFGAWKPMSYKNLPTMGALADSTSADPETFFPYAAPATAPAVTPASSAPSAWSSLWSGLSNIITPAATAYAGITANAALSQAQQRAQAQTWNPMLTGPALQAQAWQNAYQSGMGMTPSSLSVGTMAVIGIGILGVVMLTGRKK